MDFLIMQWITDVFQSPFMTSFMRVITSGGNMGFIWMLFALYFLLIKKDRRTALFLVAAVVLTWMINDCLIKGIVGRPRPFLTYPSELPALIAEPSSSSFPSGHTATSFAAMTILFAAGNPYRFIGALCAILIAFSRIYLHVHYPSDVLAGCLVGMIIGTLLVRVMNRKTEENEPVSGAEK